MVETVPMTRDEENRKLANWLGITSSKCYAGTADAHEYVGVAGYCDKCGLARQDRVPDFRTDEAANALLLEKMPAPELYCHPPDHSGPEKGWRCRPDWGLDFAVYHSDRKTAIVKAALAYREAQNI